MKLTRPAALATAIVLGTTLAACGDDAAESDGLTEVNYLTSFNTFGRDAYVYVADELGYFEEAGLEVDIKPGTGSVDVMKLIASGRADFGPADFSTVAITIANEELPVTAVGMVHQQTLAALISLEGHGIESPADLEGKKVGDQPGSTNEVLFPAYAEAAGIDADKVEFVPSTPPSLPQLLASGKVDAVGQFVVGEGLMESAADGREAVILPYGEVLPDLYGNALMTSTELADSDPETVEAFTEALLKGLQYSIDHPEETGEILAERVPTQDANVAANEVALMKPYVEGVEGAGLGSISEERVASIIASLAEAGALAADTTPDQLVDADLAPQP